MIIFRKSIMTFYVQKFYVVHCMCKIAIKENFPLFHTEKLNFNAILRNQYNKFPETTSSPLYRCIINNNWNCDSYRLEQYYQPCPSTSKQLVNNGFGVYLINFNTKKRTRINQADTPTSNASTLYIESFNMKKNDWYWTELSLSFIITARTLHLCSLK